MPLFIDPDWEYWTPDPEVISVAFTSCRQTSLDLLEVWGGEDKKIPQGFRIGKGDPDRWMPNRLAPLKFSEDRSIPSKECSFCKRVFLPKRRSGMYCNVNCKNKSQERGEIVCRHCRKLFRPKEKSQLSCSVSCANSLRNESKKKADRGLIVKMYRDGFRLVDISVCCGVSIPTVKRVVRSLPENERRLSGRRSS